MTVKKLIELLQKEKPTTLVVISRDAEGNGFSTLSTGDMAGGYFNQRERDFSDEQGRGYKPCIVFYPS